MRDAIILSTQYWSGPWFRKQQFAARMAAAGSRVLYVEPTHSILRTRNYSGDVGNPALRSRVREAGDGITVLTPRRALPKPNAPAVSRANHHLLARAVQRYGTAAGVAPDAVVIVYDVEWAGSVSALTSGPVVVDLVDDLVAYESNSVRRDYVDSCTRDLIGRAELAVFTTEPLRERYRTDRAQVVIANGFDEALFHEGVKPRPLVPQSGRPVIGFVGTLFHHIDYDMLAAVATALPDATLVLVGRQEGDPEGLRRLKTLSNVLAYGPVDPLDVPALIAGFDVCVAPFVAGRVADAVSPLKVYEYLAMGKRVVCTPLSGVLADSVASLIDFAGTTEAFVDAVRGALRSPDLPSGWRDVVSERSWSALYAAFERAMKEAGV